MNKDNYIKYFSKNILGYDYVVGDIHGCYSLLYQELENIDFNPEVDRLFCVGDLVDRGPESLEVLDILAKPWFHSVIGNHDLMAIEWLDGGASSFELYKQHGGQWFIDLDPTTQNIIVEQFQKLPLIIEIDTEYGKVGIVHAECPFNDWLYFKEVVLTGNTKVIMASVWSRNRIRNPENSTIVNIDKVYHGHTVLKTRVTLGNRNYIDTGAVFGNKLTIEKL